MSVKDCIEDIFDAFRYECGIRVSMEMTDEWFPTFAAGDTEIAPDLENPELPLDKWDSLTVSLFQDICTRNSLSGTGDGRRETFSQSLVCSIQ